MTTQSPIMATKSSEKPVVAVKSKPNIKSEAIQQSAEKSSEGLNEETTEATDKTSKNISGGGPVKDKSAENLTQAQQAEKPIEAVSQGEKSAEDDKSTEASGKAKSTKSSDKVEIKKEAFLASQKDDISPKGDEASTNSGNLGEHVSQASVQENASADPESVKEPIQKQTAVEKVTSQDNEASGEGQQKEKPEEGKRASAKVSDNSELQSQTVDPPVASSRIQNSSRFSSLLAVQVRPLTQTVQSVFFG